MSEVPPAPLEARREMRHKKFVRNQRIRTAKNTAAGIGVAAAILVTIAVVSARIEKKYSTDTTV